MPPTLLRRKLRTAARLARYEPSTFLLKTGLAAIPKRLAAQAARAYIARVGLADLLVPGKSGEFGLTDDKAVDLRNLHRLVSRLRPKVVVEFGCGYSSIALSHALHAVGGKLYIVEASEEWARNMWQKLPPQLAAIVDLRVDVPELMTLGGQLCHAFTNLPDVRPDIIYLDGPDVNAVRGSHRGLSLSGGRKFECAADPLFYEWLLYPGFVMVVDGRHTNVAFLKANFRRRWRISQSWLHDFTVFELLR